MNKKILIGIGVLIVLVFIGGRIQESEQAKTLVVQECTEDKIQSGSWESCRNAFQDANDTSICELIAEKYSYICYTYYAEELSDVNLCENIDFELWQKNGCLKTVAMKENNATICPTELCIYQIAKATNDSSICDNLKDPEVIDTGNYITSKSFCFFKIALRTQNTSICDNIETLIVEDWTPDPNTPPCVGAGACGMKAIFLNWTMSSDMCYDEINDIHLDLTCPEEAPDCTYDIYNNLRSDYI